MSERTVSIYMETQPESHSIPELVVERIHAAYDRLLTAKRDFEAEDYSSAANRAYYAIYKALIAVHAMDSQQYRRHKDAIGKFNEKYVATETFPKEFGRAIHKAAKLRDTSDYADCKCQ